ncbi:MAG: GNAT family N-acetyltransferase [Actinomycetota bacterium]
MIRVETVEDAAGLAAAWRIRAEVFVVEQGVPVAEEVDDLDTAETTTHALAWLDGELVATGRLLSDAAHPGEVHVGRVAVREAARGRGVGAAVMAHLEGVALARHGVRRRDDLVVLVALSAQEHAIGFYTRLGYSLTSGERYLDAGIWHQDMERRVRV